MNWKKIIKADSWPTPSDPRRVQYSGTCPKCGKFKSSRGEDYEQLVCPKKPEDCPMKIKGD